MSEQLQKFLSFYVPDEDLTPMITMFQIFNIKKGKHLLTPGKNCNFLAFIQQGAFRVYYHDHNDKEIVTWFSFPEMIITDLLGFYTTGKAQFFVEALEDSTVYKISKDDLEDLYKKNPRFLEFGRRFAEEALTMLMQRTLSLHTKSAEERYKELLMIPDFMQKVPLKYLASFLGVTDTSLSRIRKTIR